MLLLPPPSDWSLNTWFGLITLGVWIVMAILVALAYLIDK